MHDQADRLRQLAQRAAAGTTPDGSPAPPLVVVSGGKGGVGATTLAVNLAVTLARRRYRVVLVDANFHQPDAAMLCGLDEHETLSEVLSGRRSVQEVLQSGPAGVRVLAGAWAPETATECSPHAQERLVAELQRLGSDVDLVILDVGSGRSPAVRRFWQAASLVLLVTTADGVSVLDAYAAIKTVSGGDIPTRICTVVNRQRADGSRNDVQTRIQQASKRFLDLAIECGPSIPFDPSVSVAAQAGRPPVIATPHAELALRIEDLADQVLHALHAGKGAWRVDRPMSGFFPQPGGGPLPINGSTRWRA